MIPSRARAAAALVALAAALGGPLAAPAHAQSRAVALPRGDVFRPLLADPKQPQFLASALWASSRLRETTVGAAAFGENFGLVRWPGRAPGDGLQLGIAGGVFAQFDLRAESIDLLNADYVIGLPVTYRRGAFSGRARIYHQSSHLGDEFLLEFQPERVNLSFEAIELLASHETGNWRGYVGGEYLFRREPSDLEAWIVHGGIEYRNPAAWIRAGDLGVGRWVAGLDLKSWQNGGGPAAWSARTGLEFAPAGPPDPASRRIAVLLHYYDGFSPYGQFFTEEISAFGLGLHFTL